MTTRIEVSIRHKISLEELASELTCELNNKGLLKFVKQIDTYNCDWDFIKMLHRWTSEEMVKYEKEDDGR